MKTTLLILALLAAPTLSHAASPSCNIVNLKDGAGMLMKGPKLAIAEKADALKTPAKIFSKLGAKPKPGFLKAKTEGKLANLTSGKTSDASAKMIEKPQAHAGLKPRDNRKPLTLKDREMALQGHERRSIDNAKASWGRKTANASTANMVSKTQTKKS